MNIQGTNTGTLFTVTSPNVKIVNLNISRYNFAINLNSGNLSVIGCNMSTIDRSIHLSGASLTGVLLENNTIISSVNSINYGAVYVNATARSVVNITVKGNNIRGNGTSNSNSVRFNVSSCNNTLFFDNNNITGTYGVYLYAETSNNTITITNNNITGSSAYGVELRAYTSNNTITFTNNNITGPYAVVLYAYTNNNTITITNNNITGTSYSGVYMYAYTSNNTITFTNNNITGTSSYGVALSAYTSNNTITFTNNNITGPSGVYLYAYTSNNNINFTDNNIGGASYGMYVNCNNRGFSGLSVVNNTINATNSGGIGIGFVNLNPTDLSDILVSGNNIFAGTTTGTGISFVTGLASVTNVTINYNRVLANTGLSIPATTAGSVDANLNWWGINNITGKINGINTSNHYILNITNSSSLDNLNIGDKVNFSLLVLNTTLTNDGVGNLPDFVINGTFNGIAYNSSRADNFTYIFNISSLGNQTVHASLDDQYVNRTFAVIAAIKNSTNSTIVISLNPAQIGENITVSGQLANYTGISSVNVTVDGTIFTNIAVDVSGYWELNYTTNRTGTDLEIIVSFAGDANYDAFSNSTTFTVNKNSTNSTIVISPNPAQIGENITISGQLANYTGVTQVNVTVDGTIFTNVSVNNGYWELNYTTNRTGTDLEIIVSFAGDANYDAFSNSTTFTVAKNSTNSTVVVSHNPAQIGENITISGQLANYTGISSVNVTVDGTIFTNIVVDVSGYWELNYTTNRTGTDLEIVVSFAEDNNYDAFSNSTTFTVNKNTTNSTIVISLNPAQIGENITVSGQLANNTGISSVNVTIDGTLFNVPVNGSGYWELNYTTNRTGTFDIVVSFAGNDNYTSFSNSTSFNVTKLAINSTVNVPKTVKVGKTITISGLLVDESGNPVANAPITVTVGGKVYSLTTDSNGRWSLTYKPTHTGTVDVTVNYTGNDRCFSYTNTTVFNVVKGQVIVDIDVVKNSDGSVDVIVTVTDEYGDPIPDYKVNIDLDGKNIGNIVTNVLGIGRIHIPTNKLSVGHHVITVSSDNANYNVNPVSVEFETQNNNNDTNNTNKTSDNPVATATMKNTGIPIITIILVLISVFGITIRRKQN
ncbi:bacterial Ig-like domain protein [Methanobrevibacter cuticularis]|uniref:Bacterial Ig-like domain protein n=1 Tax=Methanobrevibacter cuticularis TaxID=47311 RepID=A0A166CTE2_9EURY|nr:bacterial Ig-like domain protein [Methanobrevibacter cuticularis]